jgi:hypothetical protein
MVTEKNTTNKNILSDRKQKRFYESQKDDHAD